MVSTVGSIAVELIASTHKFIAGMKAASTTVDRESKRMSNSVSAFSKKASGIGSAFVGGIVAGGTLAAIASLTGAIGKARQSLSDFEEIGNRAKATGLSTDTFQAISHGASLADVEQEKLNQSLTIFAKNVGLAEQGSGALYSGLLKLNPQLLQSVLHATSQEERLKLVADAMADMTDATDKAALATVVFGRGGAEMVRVLDKGGESIEKMKRNAADLGIIIPEELIARSGELDDKLTTLAKVIDVNFSQALVKAAPLLVTLAEGLVKVAEGTNKASEAIDAVKEIIKDTPNRMDAANLIRTAARQKAAVAELNEAWNEYFELQKQMGGGNAALFEVETTDALAKIAELQGKVNALDAQAKNIEVTLDTSKARAAIDQLRSSDLAALWAEAEGKPTGRKLPTVHHGVEPAGGGGGGGDGSLADKIRAAIDQDIENEAIEAAIGKGTEATKGTTRAVERFDGNSAGYFDRLGSRFEGGFRDIGTALRALPFNMRTQAAADSIGGGSGSWAGRRFTIGGGGGGGDSYDGDGRSREGGGLFASRLAMPTGGVQDASTITSGATTSGAVNVSVVVKPILEGTRLSGQSTAEIKQAASAGANIALRQFYGR